ncbi:MAG: hypothetical protein IJM44_00020 [Ruminococcus sp.]|nr:hypothetical protein [Ruminococcus sp.]
MEKNVNELLRTKIKEEHLSVIMLICGVLLCAAAIGAFSAYRDIIHRSEAEIAEMGVFGFFGAIGALGSSFVSALFYALGMVTALFGSEMTILGGTVLYALKKRTEGSYRAVRIICLVMTAALLVGASVCMIGQLKRGNEGAAILLLLVTAAAARLPVRYLFIANERLPEDVNPPETDDTEAEFETYTDTDRKDNS